MDYKKFLEDEQSRLLLEAKTAFQRLKLRVMFFLQIKLAKAIERQQKRVNSNAGGKQQ